MLFEIIKDKIREDGPISFRDYMEMALYFPEMGYYTSAKNQIGTSGDFYTSSSLTPAFGAMIGRQLEEMWNILGRKEFTIVEFGAGTGRLCHDILDYLRSNRDFYKNLNYCIIEKSSEMQKKEKQHLNEKVTWYESIKDIPEITGCILSNELLDNFSVHQVVMEDELMEVFVNFNNDFVEVLKPARNELMEYLTELNVQLPYGFRTEINLEATEWIREVATSLKRGYVLTIDYGYPSHQLYNLSRNRGTLQCYNKHRINSNVYADVAEQDITAHVNFSALEHWGLKHGLLSCGLTSLTNFLLSLGFKDYLRTLLMAETNMDLISLVRKESFLTHTLLVDMGTKFKVLLQQKGAPSSDLTCLRLDF